AIKAANSAVPTLIQALQDPDVSVRVALPLGQIGTPDAIKEAVPALIKALQDRNKWVRANAAEALKQIVRYPL
ncbi:MAG: HEAT repeat domain-containing protein, partial [Dehalococcoidia bacterium]|nr:HEAT repeat domain-containing protein [Dehalococcoidia bacterium]